MNRDKDIEITDVCIYKNSPNVELKNLVSDLEYDGSYDFNVNNMIIVGYDEKGKSYVLDENGNVVSECKKDFDNKDIIGEGCNVDYAFEDLDRMLISHLDWEPIPEAVLEDIVSCIPTDELYSDSWYHSLFNEICVGISD